jgi:hypothetical protein
MLYEAPFSNFGVLPTELFEEDDLNTIIGLCNELVPEL